MLNLKKTAIAVLALGSSAVFAGSMGPVCSAVNVTVPCEATAWDFGAKALYLKPSVYTGNSRNPLGAPITQVVPGYNWGFEVEGSYHFNTGNDLNIKWYHVGKSTSQTFGQQPLYAFKDPIVGSISDLSEGSYKTANPKWDAVTFDFGQHVDFGDNKAIRFHGGAEYAHLANSVTRTGADLLTHATVSTSYSHTANYNPTYNGFGPRIGMDLSYGIGNGLDIYANGATAILAGTRSFSTNYSDSLSNSVGTSASQTVIVPAIDAKLGAKYTYAMAQGDLTLDAGWMWVNYFNVHANESGDNNDFGLQGPYIGLKWMGNVA